MAELKREKKVPHGMHRMDGKLMKNSDMPGMKKKPNGYEMVQHGLEEYRKKAKG